MKHRFNILLLLVLLLLFPANLFSQEVAVAGNSEAVFNNYIGYITPYREAPMETILEQTARFFIGTPYVAKTLDEAEKEKLVVNLVGLDCVTFVESVLALSFAASSNNLSFDNYKEYLKRIRYRNGEVAGYASRIHYTSDWVFNNEQNGLLENISHQLSGATKETKEINFMSTHRSAYKQLAQDDAMLCKIEQIEKDINSRGGFYYLPKHDIATKAKNIPHMAMIGFVTSIDGLDTTHVGFAYKKDEELTFIHASSGKMEVVIDAQTLSSYCESQKNCKGIIVAKIN